MSRLFCIPGIVFLFCALVLSFLTSISLPFLPALDIARVHFGTSALDNSAIAMTQLRFGIWTACYYTQNDDRTCLKTAHAYSVPVMTANKEKSIVIGSSWTRGLAVHPVATAVTLIALCLSFSTHIMVTLIASLASFLAATLTLIAFAIDIALFAYVKNKMNDLDIGAKTVTGPGFWLTFVSLILCLLAGCTVCFGRRRERMSNATPSSSYPMMTAGKPTKAGLFSRFRKN